MKKIALELAKCLFELEGDSIFNDPESHWLFNDWNEKYGEKSIKYKDFTYVEAEVLELADMLLEDHLNNVLDSLEYEPYLLLMYGGFITTCFEKQLAVKTGIGFQLTFK